MNNNVPNNQDSISNEIGLLLGNKAEVGADDGNVLINIKSKDDSDIKNIINILQKFRGIIIGDGVQRGEIVVFSKGKIIEEF